jgi:hypothetical protein
LSVDIFLAASAGIESSGSSSISSSFESVVLTTLEAFCDCLIVVVVVEIMGVLFLGVVVVVVGVVVDALVGVVVVVVVGVVDALVVVVVGVVVVDVVVFFNTGVFFVIALSFVVVGFIRDGVVFSVFPVFVLPVTEVFVVAVLVVVFVVPVLVLVRLILTSDFDLSSTISKVRVFPDFGVFVLAVVVFINDVLVGVLLLEVCVELLEVEV